MSAQSSPSIPPGRVNTKAIVVHGTMSQPMKPKMAVGNASPQRTGSSSHHTKPRKRGPNRAATANRQHIGGPPGRV
jgi:hypothetical protein